MAWLARGEAQRSKSSHAALWRSGSLGSWSRSPCSARNLSSAHVWTKAGEPRDFALCQAIGDVQLVLGTAISYAYLVSSYWGISTCRGLRFVTLVGTTMCRVLLALKLLGNLRFAGF